MPVIGKEGSPFGKRPSQEGNLLKVQFVLNSQAELGDTGRLFFYLLLKNSFDPLILNERRRERDGES